MKTFSAKKIREGIVDISYRLGHEVQLSYDNGEYIVRHYYENKPLSSTAFNGFRKAVKHYELLIQSINKGEL